MLFFNTRPTNVLKRALYAAVASHRPAALRALLASHGDRAFAKGLSSLSGRLIADALTMLAIPDLIRVQGHLPRAARKRLRDLDSIAMRTTHHSPPIRSLPGPLAGARPSAIRRQWHRSPTQPLATACDT